MKRKFTLVWSVFLLALSFIILDNKVVHAADNVNGQIGFTVQAVTPPTQRDTDVSYFTPLLLPGKTQSLYVDVISKQKDPVTVYISVRNGLTNTIGEIQYYTADKPRDVTLKVPVTDMVKATQKQVTVRNFETKRVEFVVTPGQEPFKGIKMGSAYFSLNPENDPSKPKNKNGVTNTYAYEIGIVLNEDESINTGADKLNLLKVVPRLENARRGVGAKLQNPTPHILDDFNVKTTITNRSRDKVLKTAKKENMRMAPNSNFYFMNFWGIQDIKPGKYSMKIVATSHDHKWVWWRNFTITDSQAKKLNKNAAYHLTIGWIAWTIVIIAGILTVIGLIGEAWNFNKAKKNN